MNDSRFSKLGISFLLMKIAILIIVTTHFVLTGILPYLDLAGYLLLEAGLALLFRMDRKFRWVMLLSAVAAICSSIAYVLLYNVKENGSALDITLSSITAAADIASIALLCKSFYDRGVKYKSPEVWESSLNTIKNLAGLLTAYMVNTFQGLLRLKGYAALFLSSGAKLMIVMLMVYLYKYTSNMFNSTRTMLQLYERKEGEE